ncbi:hypothetical protein Mgra_00004685 [Meloidogyne graminicola]|uniref:Sodium/calcium exchanger membrane region domain-containing protein n=1 Tax=Meloidogyne graminicola TaxID=189291 RepID=A0A8S9ZRV6_9BILA|nr:hypothetical protein Mgra_00004685 [Meloidogyne graminicola]
MIKLNLSIFNIFISIIFKYLCVTPSIPYILILFSIFFCIRLLPHNNSLLIFKIYIFSPLPSKENIAKHIFSVSSKKESNNLILKCQKISSSKLVVDDHHGQFPEDLFTIDQLRKGAIFLHLFGLIYMFIALAIVCDEFFVPSLAVITQRLDISDDVAGATFMAAGGSAPEFFTSVVGTFLAKNNVGIGTIVGSATFNILCVLAFCTIFSKNCLQLSWWPLFRDVSFYVIALLILVFAFLDEQILWWESALLFGIYLAYALFMKYNNIIEIYFKNFFVYLVLELYTSKELLNNCGGERILPKFEWWSWRRPINQLHRSDTVCAHRTQNNLIINQRRRQSSIPNSGGYRRQSIPILHSGAMFRNGIISLMSQTLDEHNNNNNQNIEQQQLNGNNQFEQQSILKKTNVDLNKNYPVTTIRKSLADNGDIINNLNIRSPRVDFEEIKSLLEEEADKPLDMSWPSLWHKQILYVFLAPILFPLWLTMADVRKSEKQKYFIFTFCLSIIWIAFFSYLMVWLANTIGLTIGISTEVIGLTILAAGTSIPDLITSVIVARKGLGDMAVSSSVGSNIFDVCVGLPVPWLIFFFWQFISNFLNINERNSLIIQVSSNGLICSVGMLFLMLLILVLSVGFCNWKMNKIFGLIMIIAYLIFCALSITLEIGIINCPLRICQ